MNKCKVEYDVTIASVNKTNSKNLLLIHSDLESKKVLALKEQEEKFDIIMKKNEIQKQTLQLELDSLNQQMKDKEKGFELKLTTAVNEAKKYVYDKAETQFNTGNIKYQNVKQQFKEKQSENVQLISQISENQVQIDQLKEQLVTIKIKLDDSINMKNGFETILNILKKYEENHSCPLDMNLNFEEVEVEEINNKDINITSNNIELKKNLHHLYSIIQSNQQYYMKQIEFDDLLNKKQHDIIERDANIIEYQSQLILIENNMKNNNINNINLNQQINELKDENSIQLTLMAKLTTTKVDLENNLILLKQEKIELNERCINLRNMNSELMLMLEEQ